jgi:caffeoyl-CoA O-methyltransferase
MSAESEVVTKAHLDYIAARTAKDDAFLVELKREARAAGIPSIQISPEQASLMQILLRLAGAKEVVEVGTLAGYSAIWMARALPPGGRVRTIEYLAQHADFAERWVAKSDVADRVEVLRGAGAHVMRTMETDSADAAFLDADKASYPVYLRESLRIVKRGGLVMVDNAFAFGQLFNERPTDREANAVKAFNEVMARTKELQSLIVPIGDWLWVGVKL